jgi:hypothetical protein
MGLPTHERLEDRKGRAFLVKQSNGRQIGAREDEI